ncbi:MAG: exodeoxyribonuclease VII large subunit [Pleomorphochaeta sp.]
MNNNNVPILSVSTLTSLIKDKLNEDFPYINLIGEVSNFRPSSTGHWYFSLKDESASISAVMFKSNTWKVSRILKEGDKIQVFGNLDVYAPRGTYSIKCDSLTFIGTGDILAKLEERKIAYKKAGWFDENLKKPITKFPKTLGVITSPTTAALQDVLQVLERRAPNLNVLIIPCTVQGASAAKTISEAIDIANKFDLCDQLIVTRGGGSIEDLLPFSEEIVLKSILNSDIPIITGVGHEIDFALCDFVSDLRAPTPSAAAELVSSAFVELKNKYIELQKSIEHSMINKIQYIEEKVNKNNIENLNSFLNSKIDNIYYRSINATKDIETTIINKIQIYENKLNLAKLEISTLNPNAILDKGYSIIKDKNNKIIKSKNDVNKDDIINIVLSDGNLKAKVGE